MMQGHGLRYVCFIEPRMFYHVAYGGSVGGDGPRIKAVSAVNSYDEFLQWVTHREQKFKPAQTPAQFILIPGKKRGEITCDHLFLGDFR